MKHVKRIPSIFHLLMKAEDLKCFAGTKLQHEDDLNKIKDLLIDNYLCLINDLSSGKAIVNSNDKLYNARSQFINFCEEIKKNLFNSKTAGEFELINFIKISLRSSLKEPDIINFFSFFDSISLSENKKLLVKYGLTGDKSIYPNFKSLLNMNRNASECTIHYSKKNKNICYNWLSNIFYRNSDYNCYSNSFYINNVRSDERIKSEKLIGLLGHGALIYKISGPEGKKFIMNKAVEICSYITTHLEALSAFATNPTVVSTVTYTGIGGAVLAGTGLLGYTISQVVANCKSGYYDGVLIIDSNYFIRN